MNLPFQHRQLHVDSLDITDCMVNQKKPLPSNKGGATDIGVMYLASRPATLLNRCGFAKVGCNSTTTVVDLPNHSGNNFGCRAIRVCCTGLRWHVGAGVPLSFAACSCPIIPLFNSQTDSALR